MEYIFNFAKDNSLFTVNLPLNQEYKPYLGGFNENDFYTSYIKCNVFHYVES